MSIRRSWLGVNQDCLLKFLVSDFSVQVSAFVCLAPDTQHLKEGFEDIEVWQLTRELIPKAKERKITLNSER
jgi:hypothetical protein